MIRYETSSIFDCGAQALVNPVNCRGVMGAGLAKAFAERWPELLPAYRDACLRKALRPGHVVVHFFDPSRDPLAVIHFPTKDHWTEKSKLTTVANGLRSLVASIEEFGFESVAVPALGCGLGGLSWNLVRQAIDHALRGVDADVIVLGPRPLDAPRVKR